MKFKILDIENEIKVIEKFVVTCFLDHPSRGEVTIFAEVCLSQQGSFELITPSEIILKQDEQLYTDVHACESLFKSYTHLRGGEHIQMVGEKKLHVIPKHCAVQKVAAPRTERKACCYSILFDASPSTGRSWGTWLTWVQSAKYTGFRDHILRSNFEFQVGNIRIENFYLYVHQPPGYRMDTSTCEVSYLKAPIVASPRLHAIYEFEVSDDFAVFVPWQAFFYTRKILKNRRGIELEGNQKVVLSFTSISDHASRRIAFRSYFVGIAIGLSLGFVSEIASALIPQQFRIHFLGFALLLSFAFGVWGWKQVR